MGQKQKGKSRESYNFWLNIQVLLQSDWPRAFQNLHAPTHPTARHHSSAVFLLSLCTLSPLYVWLTCALPYKVVMTSICDLKICKFWLEKACLIVVQILIWRSCDELKLPELSRTCLCNGVSSLQNLLQNLYKTSVIWWFNMVAEGPSATILNHHISDVLYE